MESHGDRSKTPKEKVGAFGLRDRPRSYRLTERTLLAMRVVWFENPRPRPKAAPSRRSDTTTSLCADRKVLGRKSTAPIKK